MRNLIEQDESLQIRHFPGNERPEFLLRQRPHLPGKHLCRPVKRIAYLQGDTRPISSWEKNRIINLHRIFSFQSAARFEPPHNQHLRVVGQTVVRIRCVLKIVIENQCGMRRVNFFNLKSFEAAPNRAWVPALRPLWRDRFCRGSGESKKYQRTGDYECDCDNQESHGHLPKNHGLPASPLAMPSSNFVTDYSSRYFTKTTSFCASL